MVFVQDHYLIALDGTGYFPSNQIHCASCLETYNRNGTVTYRHQISGAALIHPDKREVIPLMPEPIITQDGTSKNDCERNAAKRLIITLRQDHPHLKLIVTEDSLSSNAPHIQVLQDHHLHYILGVKEGDYASLFKQVEGAEHAGRVTYYDRDDAETGLRHRFRFVSDVPRRGGKLRLEHDGEWRFSQALSDSVAKKRLESRGEATDRLSDCADERVA
jgi:hypothetical protein